MNKLAVFIR